MINSKVILQFFQHTLLSFLTVDQPTGVTGKEGAVHLSSVLQKDWKCQLVN